MDGRANSLIGTATAEITGHRGVDVGVGRLRRMREQRDRSHDLARLTITALRNIELDPRPLHRVAAIRREPFDRRDRLCFDGTYRCNAGANRLALEVHGTRAAERHATAVLGPREPDGVAEDPQKGRTRIDVHLDHPPIDVQLHAATFYTA